ncbi:MAG: hypothetical protein ACREUA_04850 [Burkholderiales bacterium]
MITTPELQVYAVAKAETMRSVEHRQDKRHNNYAENSHQPRRERGWRMREIKSVKQVQLPVFSAIGRFFRVGKRLLSAKNSVELVLLLFRAGRLGGNTDRHVTNPSNRQNGRKHLPTFGFAGFNLTQSRDLAFGQIIEPLPSQPEHLR